MPGGYSTTGILINDAGGKNPFDSYKQSGSAQLAPEEVLYTASNADVWLMRYGYEHDMTISQLGNENDIYKRFAPYTTGNVYGCNTSYSSYYEDIPFHPQWMLAELASILHPEIKVEHTHHYYFKLK